MTYPSSVVNGTQRDTVGGHESSCPAEHQKDSEDTAISRIIRLPEWICPYLAVTDRRAPGTYDASDHQRAQSALVMVISVGCAGAVMISMIVGGEISQGGVSQGEDCGGAGGWVLTVCPVGVVTVMVVP